MALTGVDRNTGPGATTSGSMLLRRFVISCPVTGLASDTGLELSELHAVLAGPQLLIDCLECGQDHPWQLDDARLVR
jgi:hypothetical protein